MEKNVFFFTHNHPENSEADTVSKHNMFEVRQGNKLPQYASTLKTSPFDQVSMIKDLVIYFLKQGPYDGAGDIAVLCAYLGQLQKVRAALKDLKIAVSVDERDEDELERAGLTGDDEIGFTQVEVARHVSTIVDFRRFTVFIILKIRIGTVDTFQGQEAKIVIISLVRNSGTFEEGQSASIGFLKVRGPIVSLI